MTSRRTLGRALEIIELTDPAALTAREISQITEDVTGWRLRYFAALNRALA
jgi:hypothetical protein